MSTKETLRRRKDIPDDQVEELVARAAQLQDESERIPDTASPVEIMAVAGELNIEPEYVEAAIEEWRQTQVDTPRSASRERVKSRGRAILKGTLLLAAALIIGVPLLAWTAWSTLGPTVVLATAGIVATIVAGIIWLLS